MGYHPTLGGRLLAFLETPAGHGEGEGKAHYNPGDDPKYGRMRDLTSNVPSSFFSQALSDPDEAWQTFLDSNVYPGGTIENVQSIIFK